MDIKLRLVIESYNNYNAGHLFGEWVDCSDFDQDDFDTLMKKLKSEYESKLNKLHNCDDELCEEWFCPDLEMSIDGEHVDLHALLFDGVGLGVVPSEAFEHFLDVKEFVEERPYLDATDLHFYQNIKDDGRYDTLEEAYDNTEIFLTIEAFHDDEVDEKIGWKCFEDGLIEIPEYIQNYFDYEKYGYAVKQDFSIARINNRTYLYR